ncbi:MAG: hypothetical protein COB50_05300 [Thiotrichales bacterium]|nr:MAG: hypothetical protein COB50_05300 [Thiotrichales bacterium]
MIKTALQSLEELVRVEADAFGCILWGVELPMYQGRRVVRIYVDGKGDSINIDVCARLAKHLNIVLKAEDVLGQKDTLEVSSPGINRKLFYRSQYAVYIGEKLSVHLNRQMDDGKKRISGILKEVTEDKIVLSIKDVVTNIEFENIRTANLLAS